jgi:hypothetical protein
MNQYQDYREYKKEYKEILTARLNDMGLPYTDSNVKMLYKLDSTHKVMRSAAGYYIGTSCAMGTPYDRYSSYYKTKEDAMEALKKQNYFR